MSSSLVVLLSIHASTVSGIQCVDKHRHGSQGKKSTCPYCRQAIESIAINQSLKDLIDNFAAQREKVSVIHYTDQIYCYYNVIIIYLMTTCFICV